jgi:large subunit ribosomal protein L3
MTASPSNAEVIVNESMGLYGRKLGMTQIYDTDGNVVPVTVIETTPNPVLRVKTTEGKDGYNALQLGFGTRRASLANKPELGQFKALEGVVAEGQAIRFVREIRVDAETAAKHTAGSVVAPADVFTVGEKVDVVGTSKGRGFAGVMKRHNHSGFKRTHGVHEFKRHGGSIGTRLTPGMTIAGMPMPGHMGDARTTVQNLVLAKLDAERNLVYVRGGVPGPVGSLVLVRKAVKTSK